MKTPFELNKPLYSGQIIISGIERFQHSGQTNRSHNVRNRQVSVPCQQFWFYIVRCCSRLGVSRMRCFQLSQDKPIGPIMSGIERFQYLVSSFGSTCI